VRAPTGHDSGQHSAPEGIAMNTTQTRRRFLADVGQGMLIAGVGYTAAMDLGLTTVRAEDKPEALTFGTLEPLVQFLQETPADRLLPAVVERLRSGTGLRQWVAAAALANARTFGGEDYVGFHTMMALAPAYHMAAELPEAQQPLPILKVYYRTVAEEFAATRKAFRWRQLVALARVTASEYGRPAPGYAESRGLLKL
jgi:hypothetical protein